MGDWYKIVERNGKKMKEHRFVMEQHLGRKLEMWEQVWHKDGRKQNNKLENLEIRIRSKREPKHSEMQESPGGASWL